MFYLRLYEVIFWAMKNMQIGLFFSGFPWDPIPSHRSSCATWPSVWNAATGMWNSRRSDRPELQVDHPRWRFFDHSGSNCNLGKIGLHNFWDFGLLLIVARKKRKFYVAFFFWIKRSEALSIWYPLNNSTSLDSRCCLLWFILWDVQNTWAWGLCDMVYCKK